MSNEQIFPVSQSMRNKLRCVITSHALVKIDDTIYYCEQCKQHFSDKKHLINNNMLLKFVAKKFIALQDRTINPDGYFDGAGRWYPHSTELCDNCSFIRQPSRAHQYTLLVHCRSLKHQIARYKLYDADVKLLRAEIKKLRNIKKN